jgi:hypothetical protein
MALSDETKREIIAMADQGHEPKAIAQALSVKPPVAVYGVLRQERVRRGLEQPPRAGTGKKKVVTTHRETWEEEPTTPGAPAAPPVASVPPVSFGGGFVTPGVEAPLFPSRPDNEIDRIDVVRRIANPRAAGEGLIGELDAEATEADIQAQWGGGRYEVRAWSANNKLLGRRTVKIAGHSRPADMEDPEGGDIELLPYGGPMGAGSNAATQALAGQLGSMQTALIKIAEKQSDAERTSADERGRQQQQFFASMLQQSQQAAQQQMLQQQQMMQQTIAMITASQRPHSDLTETIKALAALKDVMGDNGETDTLTELVKAGPKFLEGLGNLRGAGGLPPGVTIAAPPAPKPAPRPPAADPQQLRDQMVAMLLQAGWPQDEATRHVDGVLEFTVRRHQELAEAAQKRAAVGNGQKPPAAPPEPEPAQ